MNVHLIEPEEPVGHDAPITPDHAPERLAKAVAGGFDAWFANPYTKALLRSISDELKHEKLWLWKNFVDGKPEYWAFDNAYPIHLTDGDPQTFGEPCGYAIFKPSRCGRTDVSEEQVLRAIARSRAA